MPEPQPPLEKILEDAAIFYDQASSSATIWWGNFRRNTTGSLSRMTPQQWIRLVVVVCAYILLRPYVMKAMAKVQAKQLEYEGKKTQAALDGNDLRGVKKIDIPGVESDEEDEVEEVRETEWGRKARVRQRKIVRKALERHEEMLSMKGNESDKDIEDLLED